jgi:hypothetical protein
MKTEPNILAAGFFLAALATGFGQPVIITQPQNQTNALGTTAIFTVAATNGASLAYQWQKYLTNWSDLTDHTTATLVLPNVQTSDEADYRVAITNLDGATNSAPAHLYVITPPRITKVTNYNASVSLGAPVKMQVWATGTAPLSYQWWFGSLALAGKTNAILNLTNVQTTNAGLYTVVVTNWADSASTNVSLDVDPTFTKITTGAIVTDAKHWHGQAWGDYDNDGYLDVFLTTTDSTFAPIYRNNHDGTFTRTNLPSLQGYTGIANWWYNWVDYDNDGHLDLFITDYSEYFGESGKNLLFHNNGDGTFTRITTNAIVKEGAISIYGAWGDYDRDGDLDLVVANGLMASLPARNWFYENQGDGLFLKLTNAVTSGVGRFALPVWVDVDNDGWPDLFVTAWGTNSLYHNTGAGTFTKVIGDPLVSEASYWTAAAWADYDNDGDLDVFVPSGGIPGYSGPVALYRNDGAGHFTKMTTNNVGPLVSERVNSSSCAWGDYDNDGWIDLFVANGYDDHGVTSPRQCLLYRNNGDATFTKITTGSLANEWSTATAANWVDIGNTGFLDLFMTTHPDSEAFVNRLYRNNGNSNNWLCVKCVGTVSPRWGTGAKVRARATTRGMPMSQLRLIDAGGSSWGGQSFVAHFGLGDATNVDVVRIEWTSGIVQELHNVPVKQYLTVTEPARLQMTQPGQLQIQCWKGMSYSIESSPDLQDWNRLATVTNLTGKLEWTDPDTSGQSTRFYRAVKQ